MQRKVGAIEILNEYSQVTLLKAICFLSSFVGQKNKKKIQLKIIIETVEQWKIVYWRRLVWAGHNNQWIIKPGFAYQFSKLIDGFISIVSVLLIFYLMIHCNDVVLLRRNYSDEILY